MLYLELQPLIVVIVCTVLIGTDDLMLNEVPDKRVVDFPGQVRVELRFTEEQAKYVKLMSLVNCERLDDGLHLPESKVLTLGIPLDQGR